MPRFDNLFDWLRWQEGFHPRSIDLGLDRAASVYQALNPQAIKPPTIIVGGTNGKGSCIANLESIYRAQGYRVGAYTSPHILKYNERIRIDGQPVSDQVICQAFERIDAQRNGVSLSYFEFGTLAALDIFWRADLDIQLLEVGLGGRLDAVNIIDSDVSIITSICIDHIDWLGETREAIGYEKAGIFRKHTPAVIGDIDPPQSLLQQAGEKQTPLFRVNQEFYYHATEQDWDWHCNGHKQRQYKALPLPALKGEHQYRNAAAVIMAVTEMEAMLAVDELAIRQGLQSTQLAGRFQLIPGDIPVLLDVAHNTQAVTSLVDYLKADFGGRKIHAVFAMMKDKDIHGVIEIIKPFIADWFVAPLQNPRTAGKQMMQNCFQQSAVNTVDFDFETFSAAFKAAEEKAETGDLILVFGSFFLVAEYLAQLEQ